MYLGKAPRDLRFVTQLLHALRHYRLFQRGDSAELGPPSGSDPAHTESPADAAKAVDLDHDVSSTSRDDVSPVQIGLEERIIDMAAQEVHLRQIGRRLSDDRGNGSDWNTLLFDINEDIQKLLKHFNEVRHLVENEREVAPDASQACLDDLDAHWNAINKQSMQLLVISSEPDSLDTARRQLAAICEGIVVACGDTRQSCAAYLANASLERPLVST